MISKLNKGISMLIVFVIVFSYLGQTLEAVATSNTFSVIADGFFGVEEIKFKTYFLQTEHQDHEKISNVNEKPTLVLEIAPNDSQKGFLKERKYFSKWRQFPIFQNKKCDN